MSIFEMFGGSSKKEAPADEPVSTGGGESETEGVKSEPTELYINNGEVLTKSEAKDIVDDKKGNGWREQP